MLFLPVVVALVAGVVGCIREDRSGCPSDVEEFVHLRVIDIDSGVDITGMNRVDDVSLFVFDGERRLIERIDVAGGHIEDEIRIPLPGYADTEFYVSAWGNISDRIAVADAAPGDDAGLTAFTLLDAGGVGEVGGVGGLKRSTGEMFFGLQRIYINAQFSRTEERHEDIDITQINAGLSITVRGLSADTDPGAFYFRLRGQNSGYDFWGNPQEDDREIYEGGTFNADGEFVSAQPIYLIHSVDPDDIDAGNCMSLHLYKRGVAPEEDEDLTGEIRKDREEQYIPLARGNTTHILIDLTDAKVEVRVAVTGWDEIYQWSEW